MHNLIEERIPHRMIPLSSLSNQNWWRSSVLAGRNKSFQDGPKTKIDFFWDPKAPEPYQMFYIYYSELIRMLSKLIGVARVVTCDDGPRRLKSSRDVTAGGLVFRTLFLLRRCCFGRCHDPLHLDIDLFGRNESQSHEYVSSDSSSIVLEGRHCCCTDGALKVSKF